jgi:serine/threonine-protein kinase
MLLRGTPEYMPPEMALGQPGDQRTDVYLVGATLHEILTGAPRHRGATLDELLRASKISAPYAYPESVPSELAALCNRATSRSPGARPASVTEIREQLGSFIRRRSARALNEAAMERLADLETALRSPGPPQDMARAYRLVTEARFGFALNLREDPNDSKSLEGMRRCLRLAIELELRQSHPDSAEALLCELDVPDEDLHERIVAAREKGAAFRREHLRLTLLAQALDPTQHSWKRGFFLILFWAAGIAIGRLITLGGHLSPERITLGSVASTVLFCSGLFLIRHRIGVVWNTFNKQLIALVIVAMIMIVIHRVVGIVHHVPVEETMTIDLVIACGFTLYGAYAYIPRMVLAAVPLVAALPAAVLWPAHAPFLFVASLATGAPIAALVAMTVQPPLPVAPADPKKGE